MNPWAPANVPRTRSEDPGQGCGQNHYLRCDITLHFSCLQLLNVSSKLLKRPPFKSTALLHPYADCCAGVRQSLAMQSDLPKCSAMTLCSTPFCQADLQLRHSMHASLLLHAVDVPQPSAQAGSPTATASGWKVRFSRPGEEN